MMDADAEAYRRSAFALMLARATRVYLPVRHLAMASVSQTAISRAPIDMAGKVTLFHPMMGAVQFGIANALRALTNIPEKALA